MPVLYSMIENVPKGMFLITSNLLINVTRIFWQSFAFKNRKWGYNNKFGVLPDRIWRAIRFLQKCNYLLMWNLVKTKRKVARLIRSGTPKPKKNECLQKYNCLLMRYLVKAKKKWRA